ncbi:MAG: PilZ domain-containing protein [Candidatus Polarisedimenticolaceae bacterium]|nr:PilZ domain-containing protein [Candidatus Polarisedimenticolaceae bacterium]
MAVQKRYQARLKINKEIHLIYRKRAFTAYAVNLSSEGMGLQVEALSIPTGMFLELDFHIGDKHWQIPAVVTHSSTRELGVMFLSKQDLLYTSLLSDHCRPAPQAQLLTSPFPVAETASSHYL